MNDQIKGHKCIVFAIEHYNPLGIIRSLGEHGVNPVYISLPGRIPVASASKYVSKVHYVNTPEEGYCLLINEYGSGFDKERLPFLFASDDQTMGILDKYYEELKSRFIFFNAGRCGGIA